jgi:carboxysome shell carbonic anhydrase
MSRPLARAALSAAEPWGRRAARWAPPVSTPRSFAAPSAAAPAAAPIFGEDDGAHPLADAVSGPALERRALAVEGAFSAIEPTLRALAPRQWESEFPATAATILQASLGVQISLDDLSAGWTRPLDMRRLQAICTLAVFRRLMEQGPGQGPSTVEDGEGVDALVRRWGFHAVDITPCADGRLAGLTDHILRVPAAVISHRRSHAGAMFDPAQAVRRWEAVELRRWREASPVAPDSATRYLKIGVYHFSLADPDHGGCAAHGSDERRAAGALLQRLVDFQTALAAIHGPEARAAVLLVGVNTDDDSIRVHVPDANGASSIERFVESRSLWTQTRRLTREAGKGAIRAAVAACAGVPQDEPRTEGMRWFCGYLLKNNIAQVDAVHRRFGGAYPDADHAERLIIVGDPIDAVQLRNLAFQAQMETAEQGAPDLSVGVGLLRRRLEPQGLATPVLVHVSYDPRIPGAPAAARARASRLRAGVLASQPDLVQRGLLHVEAAIRAADATRLEPVEPREERS